MISASKSFFFSCLTLLNRSNLRQLSRSAEAQASKNKLIPNSPISKIFTSVLCWFHFYISMQIIKKKEKTVNEFCSETVILYKEYTPRWREIILAILMKLLKIKYPFGFIPAFTIMFQLDCI